MNETTRRVLTGIGLVACLVLGMTLTGCEDANDPTAPEGSTLIISANPQTVIVPSGGIPACNIPVQCTTTLTATVRSANGTPLPDQEVTFSTTSGQLTPDALTPIQTDDQGKAVSSFVTDSSATVTAASGAITATTQVQTSSATLSRFILNAAPDFVELCTDRITLTATVNDVSGNPVQGITVIFDTVVPTTVEGSFIGGNQVPSDLNGEAVVEWTPEGAACEAECKAPGGGCEFNITARDNTGAFESLPAEIEDRIP